MGRATGKMKLALAAAAAIQAGCLVTVDRVASPAPAFAKARAEAQAVTGRPGPAHELNVLVFDPADSELVRVSVPMWMARTLAREGHAAPGEAAEDRAARAVTRHVSLNDLERAGLGVLLEVAEGDGEQVLIWLR